VEIDDARCLKGIAAVAHGPSSRTALGTQGACIFPLVVGGLFL
jgi:hypothetical protein